MDDFSMRLGWVSSQGLGVEPLTGSLCVLVCIEKC